MTLDGLIPEALRPRTRKIVLENYALHVDIGFHAGEIGCPQSVLVTVEAWIEESHFPTCDSVAGAWDYDALYRDIAEIAGSRRFNLQETLAREIYDLVAARRGVTGLRVSTRKPDIYPGCTSVGVELSSF